MSRVTEGAFNKGRLTIEGSSRFSGVNLEIEFQNENYVAFTSNPDGSKNILATVPDLISLVEEDTGEPVTTEEVRYGLRVAAIFMPCFPLWTKPQGLATSGPAAFGYQDVTYVSVNAYKEYPPFPRYWQFRHSFARPKCSSSLLTIPRWQTLVFIAGGIKLNNKHHSFRTFRL